MAKFKAQLIPVEGETHGDPVDIPSDGLVVGRDEECDHVIDGDGISRFHACFFAESDRFFVEDMESTNGVVVNGRQIDKKCELKPGDVIQICSFDFVSGGVAIGRVTSSMLRIGVLMVILAGLLGGIYSAHRFVARQKTANGGVRGPLAILSDPDAADVYNHGKKVGITPIVFRNLAEGNYKLLLRKDGYRDKEIVMIVPQGGTRKIHSLDPILAGEGHLSIRTMPIGAKVFLDGKEVGVTVAGDAGDFMSAPLEIPKVNLAIEHDLYVTHQGSKSQTYRSKTWEPKLDVLLWNPDRLLVKMNGDVLLGMLRKKDDDGSIELATSRTIVVTIPAHEIAEFRTVLPPVFKQNQGVKMRKDADGVLELIIDPFPDDEI